jgi:hypothetical protein
MTKEGGNHYTQWFMVEALETENVMDFWRLEVYSWPFYISCHAVPGHGPFHYDCLQHLIWELKKKWLIHAQWRHLFILFIYLITTPACINAH